MKNQSSTRSSKERYIVILDILGFKERVKEKKHSRVYRELHDIKLLLSKSVRDSKNSFTIRKGIDPLDYIIFSDTILIISHGVTKSDFHCLRYYSVEIIRHCFMNSIPIKGAMAKGEISYNKKEQIIFGRPIIDAYLLAEQMNVMGIIIDKSAEKDASTIYHSYYIHDKIPLKSGNVKHYCFNIKKDDRFPENKKVFLSIQNGIKKMYLDTNANPRLYFDNTLELIDKMEDWD
jgi:hypothetical protein